ncbi:MAG: DUF6029 family protein [bacterium]
MRALIAGAAVPLLLFAPLTASSLQLGGVTIAGSNRLEYWLWRETKEEVFDDRFDIDVYYKSFLLGFRYQAVEPSNVAFFERREGLYRRYVEYDSRRFGIRAGNYYVVFGRGLVLRAYEDDLIYLDRDIDGVKIRGSIDWGDIVLVSGRPRNTEFLQLAYSVVNDTTDILRGADLSLHPFSFLTAGGSYVLLTRKDLFDPIVFRRTEVYGTNVGLNVWHIDLYGEAAKKWGWDPMLLSDGAGYGIYGSASLSFPGYGITAQFADYDSIGLGDFSSRYNSPPVLNRYGQSINRGVDETGYQVEAYLSPIEPLVVDLSYSSLKTTEPYYTLNDTLYQYFKEGFAEAVYQRPGLFDLKAGVDRTEQHGIVPGFVDFDELVPRFELTYYVLSAHSLGLGFEYRAVSCSTSLNPRVTEFRDSKVYVSYTFSPLVTVTLTGEWRDEEVEEEQPGKEWRAAQIDWDISQDHRLTVILGSEKGGLVCSGGVCRYEPSFDGIKAVLTSRF